MWALSPSGIWWSRKDSFQKRTKSAPSDSKKNLKTALERKMKYVQRLSINLSAFGDGAPPQGKIPIPNPGKILSYIFVVLHS